MLGRNRVHSLLFVSLTGTPLPQTNFAICLRWKGCGALGHQGTQADSVQALVQSIFTSSVSLSSMLKILSEDTYLLHSSVKAI